ncbi:HAD-IA family hydrolase [uncultured Sphingomonas sp.]|uniref:HAD-IA family hydrolase n=1 Tax=uncultured Sphingomonas sp. TaxID=158754 RepID=UPI0035CC3BA6
MTPFPFDIVGFDLDGTLVDSAADLSAAVNHALSVDGRAMLPVDQVRPMIGGGVRLLLERAMAATGDADAARIDALLPVLLDHYAAHIAVHTRPFPGVVAALDALAARGVTLAVMSNKLERLSVALLDALGLRNRFACIIGGDTIGIAKPDPAPIREMIRRCGGGRAAFVGDSHFDVAAAHGANIPVATFGAISGADISFTRHADLPVALEELAAGSGRSRWT